MVTHHLVAGHENPQEQAKEKAWNHHEAPMINVLVSRMIEPPSSHSRTVASLKCKLLGQRIGTHRVDDVTLFEPTLSSGHDTVLNVSKTTD